MVNSRKSTTRKEWAGLVKKLSGKTSGARKTNESGARHSGTVGAGKSRGRDVSLGSGLELTFLRQLEGLGIDGFVMEYRFHPVRRWRFDFCWPAEKIAVEIEGGTWSGGRHTTGSGFKKDCEKYNHAAKMGFCVLRFTSDMVKSGEAIEWTKEMTSGRNQSE